MKKRYIARKYQKIQNPELPDIIDGMKIDLCKDFDNLLNDRISKIGVRRKSINDSSMDYFRLMHRIIKKRPRKIEKAKDFNCPIKYAKKLEYIERCILLGRNLMPFTSRTIKDLNEEDLLLSDWGIYHFHISDELDKKKNDGFMTRSDYLLMVRIQNDTVYFIKTIPHKTKNVWGLKEYVQIIKDNWPETIERNQYDGVYSLIHLNEEQYLEYRKSHITTLLELDDGSSYMCIGGGYCADGTSSNALRENDFWYTRVECAEEIIVNNWKRFCLENRQLYELFQNIDVKEIHLINFGENKILLRESNTGLFIEIEFNKEQTNIHFKSVDQQFPLQLYDENKLLSSFNPLWKKNDISVNLSK